MDEARIDDFIIERGSIDDYALLSRFHYRSGRPATATTVYRIAHCSRSIVDRFLNRESSTSPVGVLIVSYPMLGNAMRSAALGGRYLGIDRKTAARFINEEVRTISRVIIDPRYRGLGLAVMLVHHALKHAETVYTEAIAAMGRVHPFFERAGMMRFDPPLSKDIARFQSALEVIGCPTWALASASEMQQRIKGIDSDDRRNWFVSELKRFAGNRGRGDRPDSNSAPLAESIALARTKLWARPIYYIHQRGQSLDDHNSA